MKIVVIADTGWSVGRVHSDIARSLPQHEFIFHDSAAFFQDIFLNDISNCDIILTTLNLYFDIDELITNNHRKKILLVCHGISDIKYIQNNHNFKGFSSEFTYSVTSDVLVPFLPMQVYVTPNGVKDDLFTYTQRSGKISNLAWVGAPSIAIKRIDWSNKISLATDLPLTIASNIPFDSLVQLYQTFDLLIVTSGPHESEETGPLPPFEAIVSGVLVIGTPVGNFRHIPGPKFTTIEEAIVIINELKKDPEKVCSIARMQYEYVMANYTYSVLSKKWDLVFQTIYNKN
jgi:hypothetical protein